MRGTGGCTASLTRDTKITAEKIEICEITLRKSSNIIINSYEKLTDARSLSSS